MRFGDSTNLLSGKQKKRLLEAKSNEDLDNLFTSDKQLLTEDELGSVAGEACFGPLCPICGNSLTEYKHQYLQCV